MKRTPILIVLALAGAVVAPSAAFAEEIPAVLLFAVEETTNDPASASAQTPCAPIRCEREE